MQNSSMSSVLREIDTNSSRPHLPRGEESQRSLNRSEDDRSRYSMDTTDDKPNSESAHNFAALNLEDPEAHGDDKDVIVEHTFNQVYLFIKKVELTSLT